MPETFPSSLAGKRIVITRAVAQSDALAKEIAAHGAIAVVVPLISFAEPEDLAPLDQAIAEMRQFEWLILTSAQAVRAVLQRAADLQCKLIQRDGGPRVSCVGPVTAEAARKAKLPVDYVAATHNGVALANELGDRLRGARVLLPRSDRANPDLPAALNRFGAQVTEVIAYRTLKPQAIDQEKLFDFTNGGADAILFFSPSAVQHFAELVGAEKFRRMQDMLAITAVGHVTANALQQAGVGRTVVSADTTAAAVVQALEKHFTAAKAAPAGVKPA